MSDQPETVPAIDPEPVDLGYLGDRARAYVAGLEARLKRLREENEGLRAQLNDPSRADEKHIKAAYKRGWADASSAMDAAASSATRALADLRRAAADAWMTEPAPNPKETDR